MQLLLRLSPMVPFGLLNYLLGLTNTSFVTYVTCTGIGILPGSIVDICIGVIGKSAGDTAQFTYLLAGLIATVALVVLITVKARGYLREAGIKVWFRPALDRRWSGRIFEIYFALPARERFPSRHYAPL